MLAILLALVEVSLDWTTWVELDVSKVYGLPLVVAAMSGSRRLLWALAAGLMLTTFAVYAAQIEPGAFSGAEPYFINRVLSAVTLMLLAGVCHVWIGTANKLAAQRRMAEEASRRKTQLLASVSHDIRTPLATIDLIADLLQRSVESAVVATHVPDLVERLRRNTRSLAELVSALLDISFLDAGRIPVHESEFSLNALLEEERLRMQLLAQAKGLRLVTEAPDPPVCLRTDRIKLSRVLSNLIGNAIKFTAQGTVTVAAARAPDGSLRVRVSDTGIGMAPESVQHIFDEYGQLGNPGRDSRKGWGLGLAICRRLVLAIGGSITVQSQPGRGTTFSVQLPESCVVKP